jgi:CheY-like chemotaxis protein
VALTGHAGEMHRRRCLEAGFDFHLAKPADPEEVRRLLAGR